MAREQGRGSRGEGALGREQGRGSRGSGGSRDPIVTKLGRNAIGTKTNPSQPVLEYFGHFKFFDTRSFIWAWQVSQLLQRLEIAHKDGYSLYLGPGSSFDTKLVRKRPVLIRSHLRTKMFPLIFCTLKCRILGVLVAQ